MRARKGFTLVEILIVVVILGILAAIVIPQFSQASSDAKLSSLRSNLQTMRSQIALYKVQNSDNLPPADTLANFEGAMCPEYLQSVPNNPFTGGNTITQGDNTGLAGAPGDGSSDWYLNTTEGIVYANDTGTLDDGTAHSTF
ncbi:PilD-dependent protein PddA [Anaerohalosphaera lusitana]|uniref:PilD-dependent protein PddA n=1 Tax=Anaerohalosphaera lusitana TaxID=1936003 RepID=A0A1U9NMC9_9BACT|nr:type II secretion system protein [Anaerohalosphaera lusitana]AQT68894.1 PilD-dependent protein PddA [Anaerohalosphaera lusitana]